MPAAMSSKPWEPMALGVRPWPAMLEGGQLDSVPHNLLELLHACQDAHVDVLVPHGQDYASNDGGVHLRKKDRHRSEPCMCRWSTEVTGEQ